MQKPEVELMIDGTAVDLEPVVSGSSRKIVVYTAIFGGYDDPPSVENIDEEIDYLLFTDGSVTEMPAPWQIRIVDPIFVDPQRDARRIKLLPHLFLPKHYEISVWVDASLVLRNVSADVIGQLLNEVDIAVTQHNQRSCIYDEAQAVLDVRYESPARVARQMQRYKMCGFPEQFGLHATMFLLRRHTLPRCFRFNLDWWHEVSQFSKRDQLSFDWTRWRHPFVRVNTLQMEIARNPIFGFKMTDGREHKSGRRIVDEHLRARLLPANTGDDPATSYNDLHEIVSTDFSAHLRNLRRITMACGEEVPPDLYSIGTDPVHLHTPPDPRRGEEWEIFLRALAGRENLLAIGLGSGGYAAMALTHSPVSVTVIEQGTGRHIDPCAAYLSAYFGERFELRRMPQPTYKQDTDMLNGVDIVHIDAGHDTATALWNIGFAILHAREAMTLSVSGIARSGITPILSYLRVRGALSPVGDLVCANQAVFTLNLRNKMTREELEAALLLRKPRLWA